MEYPAPKLKIGNDEFELISYEEFRDKRGLLQISNQTIINHLEKGNLDFSTIGRFRYLVWNDKAKNFNLNYQKQLNG